MFFQIFSRFFQIFLKEDGMKFVSYYKFSLLTIQQLSCNKYHLWWLHLLLTSHKLNREHAYKLATSTFHLVVETEKFIQSNHYFSKTLFFFSRVANSLNKLFNIFNCRAWNFAWNTNCVYSLSFSFLLRHFLKTF